MIKSGVASGTHGREDLNVVLRLSGESVLHPLAIIVEHAMNVMAATLEPRALHTFNHFFKPKFELLEMCTPSPHHPIGAKGVGESATVGSPAAFVNAVIDAVAHLGIRNIDMPMLPDRVWSAIKNAGG